jgi:hypothetical protein
MFSQDEPDSGCPSLSPIGRAAPLARSGSFLAGKTVKTTLKSICYAFLADLENKTILKYRKKKAYVVWLLFFPHIEKFCEQNLPGLANCLCYRDNILFQSARNLPVTCQKGNHLPHRAGIPGKRSKTP